VLHAFQPGRRPTPPSAPRATKRAGAGAGTARVYWCAACRTTITTEEACIDVAGAHRHRFTNPAGIEYEIGCFADAAGCRVDGEPTLELTWSPVLNGLSRRAKTVASTSVGASSPTARASSG